MPLDEPLLARKLRQGGVARSPLPETDQIGETFARFVEDRLRPILKTIIGAMVIDCRVVKLSEAIGTVSIPAMLGLVEVEEADTPALVNIDTNLAFHLIDLTLGGDPAAAPVPTARSFTAIDMALCRMHLEALVAAFGDALGVSLGRPLGRRMEIRDQRQNVSQIRLAPDYVDVLTLSVGLDIGEAARTGEFSLILPLSTLDVIRAATRAPAGEADKPRPNDLWKLMMRRAAANAPVRIDAVLHRQTLTLAAIQQLAVGQVLEVPPQAPQEIQLTIGQPDGRGAVIARARLGAYQGGKVVKLASPLDPRVAEHVTRALDPGRPRLERADPAPLMIGAEVPETGDQPAT